MTDSQDFTMPAPSGAISKFIAAQPAHVQAGIHAYRHAITHGRKDWHRAVAVAIETAFREAANGQS